ncbi:hypothetical protein EVAR_56951_1 [Eumeta japonica]|uniref:Uncharacterized protein n=1 Tax=Eumeta variegata TaxID=151549 RepID=A0A4C1YSA1_EUMVA|nr:hypothetical protein EVAR_56951_1 [Eumeta japonica]
MEVKINLSREPTKRSAATRPSEEFNSEWNDDSNNSNELDITTIQRDEKHPSPRPAHPSNKHVVTTPSGYSFIRFSKKAKAQSRPPSSTPAASAPAPSAYTAAPVKSTKSIYDALSSSWKLFEPSVALQ